jgi:hypothetical protein
VRAEKLKLELSLSGTKSGSHSGMGVYQDARPSRRANWLKPPSPAQSRPPKSW